MCNEMFGIHIIKILSYISPSRIYFIIISQCAVKTKLNILTLQYHYYKPISHLQLTLKSIHLMLLTLLYCPTCLLMGMSPLLMACLHFALYVFSAFEKEVATTPVLLPWDSRDRGARQSTIHGIAKSWTLAIHTEVIFLLKGLSKTSAHW